MRAAQAETKEPFQAPTSCAPALPHSAPSRPLEPPPAPSLLPQGSLPLASLVRPLAPSMLPFAPLLRLHAPLLLPLKRSCSLSRTKTTISNLKFEINIIYIYIIYTPSNLRFAIIVLKRKREQGRFKGSIKRARESIKGARGSIERALGEH